MLMDNIVMRFLNKMADLLLLNLLFLICSLPIVTIGPAITAMYAVSLRSVRYGDGYVVREFVKAFKNSFAQSFFAGLVTMVLSCLFYIDIIFWLKMDLGVISQAMILVSSIFIFFVFIILLWLFPVIAKMKDKLSANIRNAAAFAIGHFFPYTILCAVITGAVFYMAYVNLAADIVMLLIGFALLSYVLSFLFYKVFANYLDEESLGDDDLLYQNNEKADFKSYDSF